ncbi:MAG: phosphodiesterase [Rhizobiales bacterium]|nr:phosphodiesterase [Hyphomicrobiales bacterium]NRB15775.1 phosphodiesterase [Hyphomicrobiales bacterium]
MKFIHITDLHLTAPETALNGSNPVDRLNACLQDIENWHSDAAFCVLSGDLSEFSESCSYTWLKDRLAAFSIPCFLMIGNHDDRTIFLNVFPDQPKDSNGFVQHVHTSDGRVFIFLDTTKDGKNVHEGQLCPSRLIWLKNQLVQAGDKPCYLFMHHPPFNIGISYVDDIKLEEAEEFAQTLESGQNIQHVFFGHVHRMTYVNWRGTSFTSLPSLNHQIPLVSESVKGEYCTEPPAYGVVMVEPDQLTVHFNTFLQRDPLHQTKLHN